MRYLISISSPPGVTSATAEALSPPGVASNISTVSAVSSPPGVAAAAAVGSPPGVTVTVSVCSADASVADAAAGALGFADFAGGPVDLARAFAFFALPFDF